MQTTSRTHAWFVPLRPLFHRGSEGRVGQGKTVVIATANSFLVNHLGFVEDFASQVESFFQDGEFMSSGFFAILILDLIVLNFDAVAWKWFDRFCAFITKFLELLNRLDRLHERLHFFSSELTTKIWHFGILDSQSANPIDKLVDLIRLPVLAVLILLTHLPTRIECFCFPRFDFIGRVASFEQVLDVILVMLIATEFVLGLWSGRLAAPFDGTLQAKDAVAFLVLNAFVACR